MPMSDHDLLVETHTLVKEMWDAMYGNGRPGLGDRLAAVETRLDERTRRAAVTGGVAGGLLSAVSAVIVAVLAKIGVN